MRRSHRHTLKPGKYSVTIAAQRADVPGSKPAHPQIHDRDLDKTNSGWDVEPMGERRLLGASTGRVEVAAGAARNHGGGLRE